MKRQLCIQCNRPISVCFCHTIKYINNSWPIWILQHSAEKKHAIGTAKIAQLSLKNITNFETHSSSKNTAFESIIETSNPLLIYPSENAMTLSQLKSQEIQTNKSQPFSPRPILFLDGSWRKTYRMFFEYPALKQLQCIAINPESTSNYRIRKEPNDLSISTIEAIAHVLSTLENNTNKYQSLLDTMNWIIDKQIECMGKTVYEKNYINKKNDCHHK